jgi:hypothetical protein
MKTVKSNRDNIRNKLSDCSNKHKVEAYRNLILTDQGTLEAIDRLVAEVEA